MIGDDPKSPPAQLHRLPKKSRVSFKHRFTHTAPKRRPCPAVHRRDTTRGVFRHTRRTSSAESKCEKSWAPLNHQACGGSFEQDFRAPLKSTESMFLGMEKFSSQSGVAAAHPAGRTNRAPRRPQRAIGSPRNLVAMPVHNARGQDRNDRECNQWAQKPAAGLLWKVVAIYGAGYMKR